MAVLHKPKFLHSRLVAEISVSYRMHKSRANLVIPAVYEQLAARAQRGKAGIVLAVSEKAAAILCPSLSGDGRQRQKIVANH